MFIYKRLELINKREFVFVALDKNTKTFIVYIANLLIFLTIHINFFCQAEVGVLLVNKVSVKILSEYSNYGNTFLSKLAIELTENTGINKYAIKLVKGKLPLYSPIYSSESVELETLKTFIKTHLKIGFI